MKSKSQFKKQKRQPGREAPFGVRIRYRDEPKRRSAVIVAEFEVPDRVPIDAWNRIEKGLARLAHSMKAGVALDADSAIDAYLAQAGRA